MHAIDDQQYAILLIPLAINIIDRSGNGTNWQFDAARGMYPGNAPLPLS